MYYYLFIVENFLNKYFYLQALFIMLVVMIYYAFKQIIFNENKTPKNLKIIFMAIFPLWFFLAWTSDYAYNYVFRQELKNLGNNYNVYVENKLFNKPKEIVNVLVHTHSGFKGRVSNLSDKCVSVNVLSKTKTIKTLICKSKQSRLNLYGVFVQEMMGKEFNAMMIGSIVQNGSYPVLDEIFKDKE